MKREEGITLVSLVITIVVLVILVGVSVLTAINTGLIENTKTSGQEYMSKAEEEQGRLQQGKLAMGGSITLENSVTLSETEAGKILNYKIYGNSVQNGEPTLETPVEIESVGNKTLNLYAGEREHTYSSLTNNTHKSFYDAFEIGKTYTLFMYIDNSQATESARFRMSVGKTVDGTNGWNYLYSTWVTAGNKGYSKLKITIPENYNSKLNMQYIPNGGTVNFMDIMLVEGNYDLNSLPEYEPYGKYKIPIKVNDEITNIYLDEPLRKIGNYADYIDFESQKVVRNVEVLYDTGTQTIEESYQGLDNSKNEYIDLPKIKTQDQVTKIEVLTNISPSKTELSY